MSQLDFNFKLPAIRQLVASLRRQDALVLIKQGNSGLQLLSKELDSGD